MSHSAVRPAMWGVRIRFRTCSKRLAVSTVSGSSSKTWSAAPASRAGFECLDHCRLVDDAAARRVDQDRPRLHRREGRGIDRAAGRGQQWHVNADDVRRRHELLQRLAIADAVPGRLALADMGIEASDRHVESARLAGDHAGDRTVADQPQLLARDLLADQALARPGAAQHLCGGEISAAQERQRRGDHVFGDRDVVGAARRQHLDAAHGAGCDVDVVEADAETADRFEPLAGLQHRAPNLRSIAHDQRARRRQERAQLIRALEQHRLVQHLVVAGEIVDRRPLHELADHDLGHLASPPGRAQPCPLRVRARCTRR